MSYSESVVLILDDDLSVLNALQRSLRRCWPSDLPPPRLLMHREPTGALGDLLTIAVDVILTDYRMPLMDGSEFLRRARDLQPNVTRVLLSGSPDLDGLLRAVNQGGAIRVVLKPWDDVQLVELISGLVRQRQILFDDAKQAQAWRASYGVLSIGNPRIESDRLPLIEVIDADRRMTSDQSASDKASRQ